MARIGMGLIVYGATGNYNPALDPLVPMETGPIMYDPISGLPTTASEIQQTLGMDYPVNWSGGIGALGQDDDSGDDDDGTTYDDGSGLLDSLPVTTLSTTDSSLLDTNLSDISTGNISGSVYNAGGQSYQLVDPTTLVPAPSDVSTVTGPVDPAGNAVPASVTSAQIQAATNAIATGQPSTISSAVTPSVLSTLATQGTSTGLTTAQITSIFSAAANAGVAVFKATSSPSIIPGTNLVYNPATGQVSSASGLTSSGLASVDIASQLTSMLPILLLGGGAILLVMMMSGGGKH